MHIAGPVKTCIRLCEQFTKVLGYQSNNDLNGQLHKVYKAFKLYIYIIKISMVLITFMNKYTS